MVRAEQENAPYPMRELPKGEVVFQKQTTLREVVRHEGDDPVRLLDAPINFEARDLGNSRLYIASFPETSLFEGNKFSAVLSEALPKGRVEYRQSDQALLNDWIILIEEERKKNPEYQRLYDRHVASNSQIREEFAEFELNHFGAFWGAMHGPYSSDRGFDHEVERLVWWEKDEAALDFLQNHYEVFIKSDYERRYLSGNSSQHFLDDFLRSKGFNLGEEWNLWDIEKIFEDLTALDRGRLIKEFYNRLSFLEKDRLLMIARINSRLNDLWDTTFVNENGFDTFSTDIYNRVAKKRLDNGLIELRKGSSYGSSYVRVEFILDQQTGFLKPRIVERYTAPEDKGLSPVIIWERDRETGRGKYFCGRITEELIRAYPHLFSNRHDSLFGQIVVVAYSQELRDELPQLFPLETGGYYQLMKEAQIPVLVKKFNEPFVNRSPVILGFEDLAPPR